jgi:sigma-E factor negative regulatory protein RseB
MVSSEPVSPSLDLNDFTWYAEPAGSAPVPVESDWICDDLPAGFEVVSTMSEELPGAEAPVTHIVYSDGLAAVSVFVGRKSRETIAERSRIGSSSSYSTTFEDHRITAVGEVPQETVQRIAVSMRRAD